MSSYHWIINATITSTIVAILIVIVRLCLRKSLTGKLKYYLWIIFLVRLMVIPLPESSISIYNLLPDKNVIQTENKLNKIVTINDDILNDTQIKQSNDYNMINHSRYINLNKNIFSKMYMTIVILISLVTLTNYLIFIFKSKRNTKKVKPEYLRRLTEIKKILSIRRNITLIYGDTACIYGFFKVTLVIPEEITIDDLDPVLVHELIHYKYGDLLINWLLIILKAIYWFNPIVWLVFKQIRKDCEVACDERVIESKVVDKKSYAIVLFKNAISGKKYLVGTSSFSKEGSNIKGRIKMIQKFNKKKRLFTILGVGVFLIVGAICLTNGFSNLTNDNRILANDKENIDEKSNESAINNIVMINIFNGGTGKEIDVKEKDYINKIINNLKNIDFIKGESSKDVDGYSFSLRFYDLKGNIKDTVVINSKDTIIYKDYFYKDKNSSIDFDFIYSLFSEKDETKISQSNEGTHNDNVLSKPDINLNDMVVKVKSYILNDQGDKPEALKLKWSNTFLEQVDFKIMYDNYLSEGGTSDDIEGFSKYITLNAPIQGNWEELFKKDLFNIYGVELAKIEHLENDLYQAYINLDGKEIPYVVVSSRTGYFHG